VSPFNILATLANEPSGKIFLDAQGISDGDGARAAFELLASTLARRHAIMLFDGVLHAKEKDRAKLAERRWKHFQQQLARVSSLSEHERVTLAAAAERVMALR
jgi:hypothetical protein